MRWVGRRNRSSNESWLRSRRVSGRAPERAAPFCASRRDVGTHHSGVEHLNQVRRLTRSSQRLEKRLEDTHLAQSPETFPNAVPVAELGGKRPPGNVVDREVVQC